MVHEFDGTEYDKLRDMQVAGRAKYLELVRGGMNFAQAARAVGVSKRTGKVWRNGRTRSTGRNERPLADWYRGDMDKPKTTSARYLGLDKRITIADMHRAGSGVRAIARALGRAPSTVSRELHRNADDIGGGCGPNRAQQKAAHRLRRPKDRKIAPGTRLWERGQGGSGHALEPRADQRKAPARASRRRQHERVPRDPSTKPSTCREGASCTSSSSRPCAAAAPPAGPGATASPGAPGSASPWS